MILLCAIVSCSGSHINTIKTENYSESFSISEDLTNTGILRIHLPKNRPKNMSITAPDGQWFIIQSSEEKIEAIPQVQFMNLGTIEFKVSDLKGTFWQEGKKSRGIVFKSKGKYLIFFADNLETEPENTFSFSKTVIY